jgi:2-polyprenyl-3-methyl-5-hydroxy-6-metoxy-1,4-benzoquinol methylase/spore coat polysaccharide biosynthesis predicted glycosyltransferase SpsG
MNIIKYFPGTIIVGNNILTVPCCEKGRGGGHLTRCIKLVQDLRILGKEAYLLADVNDNIKNLLEIHQFDNSYIVSEKKICDKNWDLIILDRFQTPLDEISRWKKIAPVIGIDEGGSFRDNFDFLVDILIPEKLGKPRANIASHALIKLPQDFKRKDTQRKPDDVLKILIAFGQEDPAGLGLKTARALSAAKKKHPVEITLLRGSLYKGKVFHLPDVKALESISNLAGHLYKYDIVITHYGITAYEALYAGAQVFLAHPSKLHKKLAKAAGFCNFKHYQQLQTRAISPDCLPNKSLAGLCYGFSPQVNRCCPVCCAEIWRSVARFADRTYRRCFECRIIYMDRTCPPPIEYEREYFFESYVKQYGKTYLEDFKNIKTLGKQRLKHINSILSRRDGAAHKSNTSEAPALLDIGCAYGPFLAAAREEGFLPYGIDPAKDAVFYVQEELDIPAVQGFFPEDCPALPASCDVVTLWLVIEHFRDCSKVLTAIKNILKPGGILAFSTPSFSGVSGRFNLSRFLSASPADHWTVWSPAMCKKALALAGFKVKKIEVTGCHPERFPLLGRFAKNRKSPLYRVLSATSKLFRLGDTFEVYATLC